MKFIVIILLWQHILYLCTLFLVQGGNCNNKDKKIYYSLLMYLPCILYSLLSRPTNAIYIYIYINVLYIVITPTCFDIPASHSGMMWVHRNTYVGIRT